MFPLPPRRVVITGIGLVTPLGGDTATTWSKLLAGEPGLRRLSPEHLAGLPQSPVIPPGLLAGGPANADRLSPEYLTSEPVMDLALQAAREAHQTAQLARDDVDPTRAAVVIGTSKGGLRSFARFQKHANPADWIWFASDAPALHIARHFGYRGGALCPVAACATGLAAIDRAGELIRHGHCDLALAGSTDASLLPILQGSFHRLGVLARAFDDPAVACRPFDRTRDGFLIGEGAAVLVLEDRDRALARGATILAEFLGAVQLSDAAGLTQLEPQSPALVELLRRLPTACGFDWSDVGYLNLHGTGTEMNDACEAAAIQTALGPAACDIPCSSLKGTFGHLLGAAGSVEAALTVLALHHGILPANRNLDTPLAGCELNLLREPQPNRGNVAVKLSLGFGGHLIGAAFRKHVE